MDPPFTGQFRFTVDRVGEIGAFTECNGLSVEVEVEEVKEGGQNHFSHKLPGRMKWPNIVLKRGVTKADELFDWFRKTSGQGFSQEHNKLTRGTGSVSLVNAKGEPIRTWSFLDAFPVKWTGPTFASGTNAAAVEELEIAHHGFTATTQSS